MDQLENKLPVGIVPCSLIDYPGRSAIVVFMPGCNLRCPYCQNVETVLEQGLEPYALEEVFGLMRRRVGYIDAVVVTGGEPTLPANRNSVKLILDRAKELGFETKVDTNGTFLGEQEVLDFNPSYWAIDYKQPDSEVLAGIEKLARHIEPGGVRFELRTTAHPSLLSIDALKKMGDDVARFNNHPQFAGWYLQPYRRCEGFDTDLQHCETVWHVGDGSTASIEAVSKMCGAKLREEGEEWHM